MDTEDNLLLRIAKISDHTPQIINEPNNVRGSSRAEFALPYRFSRPAPDLFDQSTALLLHVEVLQEPMQCDQPERLLIAGKMAVKREGPGISWQRSCSCPRFHGQ